MLANEKRGDCAFSPKNHNHEDCEGIKDPKTRKTLARKYGRCFLCLFKGHRASNCTVKRRCNVCKGAHHVALCDARPKEDDRNDKAVKPDEKSKQFLENTNVHATSSSSNLHAGIGGLVALQTACGILRGEREAKVRVLFDAGSHRSFVTSRAAGLANPKGLRREFLGINTLGL